MSEPKERKSNAGRKPVEDKKIQVSVYIRQSIVSAKGGLQEFQQFLAKAIENNKNNLLDNQ